jgi:hypothetical protein
VQWEILDRQRTLVLQDLLDGLVALEEQAQQVKRVLLAQMDERVLLALLEQLAIRVRRVARDQLGQQEHLLQVPLELERQVLLDTEDPLVMLVLKDVKETLGRLVAWAPQVLLVLTEM